MNKAEIFEQTSPRKHYSDIASDIPPGSTYGLCPLTFYLTFLQASTLNTLTVYRTFYLAFILSFCLAFYLTFSVAPG